MSGRLADKVALVTGAVSGIGAACAARFTAEGARVLGMDLADQGDGAWGRAAAAGAELVRGDVRDEGAVAQAVAAATGRFGGLDVVVNAAGIAGGGPVHLLPLEDWRRVIDVNLTGTFLVCKHAVAVMLERGGGGSIVNVASVEGLEGSEGGSVYNASKGGVVLLTKAMAMDYARRGIRVNAVCPGFVDTPLLRRVFDDMGLGEFKAKVADAHQVGRLGRADEIAAAALFLASDDASFVTGHAMPVDGGYTAGHRHGFAKMMGLE
jgi:NAD(P)-dependent dehydrogenase (short-subunit alcohol dehydrogenase family)